MAEHEFYSIDPDLRPDPATYAFDLKARLASVVGLQSKVPNNAYTVQALGEERAGHGVVIMIRGWC